MKYSIAAIFFALLLAAPANAGSIPEIGDDLEVRGHRSKLAVELYRVKKIAFSINDTALESDYGGIDYYKIYYGRNSSLPNPKTKIIDGSEDGVLFKKLRSGQDYYFRIYTYFNDGSRSTVFKTKFYTKPNRPRFLKVKKRKATTARIKWRKPYRNVSLTRFHFKIYKVHGENDFSIVENTEFTLKNKLDLVGLEPDTRYYYVARARVLANDWTNFTEKRFFRTKAE